MAQILQRVAEDAVQDGVPIKDGVPMVQTQKGAEEGVPMAKFQKSAADAVQRIAEEVIKDGVPIAAMSHTQGRGRRGVRREVSFAGEPERNLFLAELIAAAKRGASLAEVAAMSDGFHAEGTRS